MHKESAKRREQKRKQMAAQRARRTPQQREAEIQYTRAYRARTKENQNAYRRARAHSQKFKPTANEADFHRMGLRIWDSGDLNRDTNRLARNATRYAQRIEAIAIELLQRRESSAQAQEACDHVQETYERAEREAARWSKTETPRSVHPAKA